MAVADLIYSIAGDSSKFIRALQQADAQLQKSIKGMSQIGKVGAYVTAGLGAVGTALGELSRQALNDMVEIQRAADRVGMSAEQMSKLGYAAELSGIQFDELADAVQEFNLKIGEARTGDQASIDAFRQLGVAVNDASGALRPAGDVLEDVIDALARVPDKASQSALAAKVLGEEAGIKLAPLLSQGSGALKAMGDEAQRLGLVFDDTAGKSALALRENLSRLQGAAEGMGRYLVQVFTPALLEMSGKLVEGAMDAGEMASRQKAATETMRAMLLVVRALGFGVKALSLTFAQLGAGLKTAVEATFTNLVATAELAQKIMSRGLGRGEETAQMFREYGRKVAEAETRRNATLIEMQKDRNESWDNFLKDMAAINKPMAPMPAPDPNAPSPEDWAKAQQIRQQAQTAKEKVQAEIAELRRIFDLGLLDVGTYEKRKKQLEDQMRRIGRSGGKAFGDGLKESMAKNIEDATQAGVAMGQSVLAGALRVVQERRDAVANAMADAMAKVAEAREKAKQEMDALQAEGQAVTQATLTGAQSVTAEYERLNALRQVGAISAETMATAMRNLAGDDILTDVQRTQAELDKLNELLKLGAISAAEYDVALNKLFAKTPAKLTEAQNFGIDAAKALQSSFADFLFDPFGQGLDGMVKGFASAMARIVAELLAKKAVLALLGAGGASPEFLAGLNFADGGYVSGPGTGTSDSIPARLSNGEYVMPAKTVSHFGVDFMDAIRAMRPARQAPVARFAEGGYVNQQASSGGGVRVVNVVDSSMVQDFLTSSAGEQVILNTIRRNRRQVSQVMG